MELRKSEYNKGCEKFVRRDVLTVFLQFLVDKNGTPVKRYGSGANPNSIAADIEPLLA